MKKKKFNELIQKPLRFHHQDIHEELEEIKGMLRDVSYQVQVLREDFRRTSVTTPLLSVQQPYVHPWWQYQRIGSIPSRDNLGGSVKASGSINLDKKRSTVSGTEEAA